MMNEELSRALHKEADGFDMSPQMPRQVARKIAVRRTLAVGTIALILVGGSAGVLYGAGALREEQPKIGPIQTGPTVPVPDQALIVCTDEGAEAVTPQVRPQADGIHITIDNRTNKNEFHLRDAEMSSPNHGGRLEREARNEIVTTFAPGEMLVGCFEEESAPYSEVVGQGYATLEIVDPEGLWVSPELVCGAPAGLRSEDMLSATIEEAQLPDAAREELIGIQSTDELLPAGYPGTGWHQDLVLAVLRDGQTVATIGFWRAEGWDVMVTSCPDSGISAADETSPTPVDHSNAWDFYNDDEHGFTIGYPGNWYRAEESMTPKLGDPEEIVALATYELVYRETDCNHMPRSALEDLGPRDAFVTLQERHDGDLSDYPPRPEDFKEAAEPQSGFECSPMEGEEMHWIAFQDQGRMFYALTAFGPEADSEIKDQAWEVLNSFEPEPAG